MTGRQKNKTLVANFKKTVRLILKCTNATPFRGYWGIGYACTYCDYQSAATSELKLHTLTAHAQNNNELENLKYVSDMIIKLDVTALKCEICNAEIDSLSKTMNHLKTMHRQPIHLGISNHIVPFNFGKEGLTCALCPEQFNYFKHLSEHMNEHFPNYPCKECSRCFINKRSLRTHTIRHMTGTFVCAFCPKIFDTRIKMKEHERVLHLKGSKTRKCGYCEERFMDALRKTEHEVKEHGAPVRKFACKECGKCFDSQRSVKNHMNQFHLQLRPHKCTECGKGFYSKTELKRHMVKHTKIKEFQCSVCSKFYVSRGSLRHHMKIHDNEKTYSCESCGETFVQKNVWVHHMTNQACKLK